jgi:DNA invertase Pin-like site-specific DNA recombinase
MANAANDEFTARMFEAINGMLLDMLAAIARKDYDDRRRRQQQGQPQRRHRGHAGEQSFLDHDPEGDGLQPRNDREDCQARRR